VEPGGIELIIACCPLNSLPYSIFQGRDFALSCYFRRDRADGESGQLLAHPVSFDMQVFVCLDLNGGSVLPCPTTINID
jgi:hypothetical protein